jgi:hypothetical protein
MSTTIKAQIAIVNLGLAQIEGLMGDDGQRNNMVCGNPSHFSGGREATQGILIPVSFLIR